MPKRGDTLCRFGPKRGQSYLPFFRRSMGNDNAFYTDGMWLFGAVVTLLAVFCASFVQERSVYRAASGTRCSVICLSDDRSDYLLGCDRPVCVFNTNGLVQQPFRRFFS